MDPMFVNMTKESTMSWMKKLGFHDRMIDELIMAVTRANYGQSSDVHAFVGMRISIFFINLYNEINFR